MKRTKMFPVVQEYVEYKYPTQEIWTTEPISDKDYNEISERQKKAIKKTLEWSLKTL